MNKKNTRIAKNTIVLYFRQILTMLIGLYTVRVVLEQLGIEDYGIYNVIGGVVALFMFVSGAMAAATQRFFSFALGNDDSVLLKKTFSINIIIYIIIAIVVYFLLETVGLWFVEYKLNVPDNKMSSALFLYHFSSLTFIATIITSPFTAIIIAHEDMHIFAYISIFEAILRLLSVILLCYISVDKLDVYGVLIFIISLINCGIYIYVCCRKYNECDFRKIYWDQSLFKNILTFTGWTVFGQFTSVARNQAVTILINQHFNPMIVAARAIANNVSGYLSTFSNNFNTSLYPPIIKSYAAKDSILMFGLIFIGSKMTFFLMWVLSLPVILEMDAILNLWLNDVPTYTVIFAQLSIIEVLINTIGSPLMTAARASGKLKIYELPLGIIQVLIFFISWILLDLDFQAVSVYWVAIIANIIMFVLRILIVNIQIGFPISDFIKCVCFPMSLVIVTSSLSAYGLKLVLPEGLIFSMCVALSAVLFSCLVMYYFGLNSQERIYVKGVILTKLNKYK